MTVKMKETDTYYTNLFRNRLEENDWVNKEMAPGPLWHIKIKWIENPLDLREAMLLESLVTGLETGEWMVAFRCHTQAVGYCKDLAGKRPISIYTDAIHILSQRLSNYVEELEKDNAKNIKSIEDINRLILNS